MKLQTRTFGEIEINDSEIITFKEGLPGFPDDRRFVLLAEDDSPICFLQSADDGDTSFVLVDMTELAGNSYDPLVDESALAAFGDYNPADLLIYNICTLHGDLQKSTVNLKAPVVIDSAKKIGRQIVCANEEYSVKAAVFAEAGARGDV